MNPLSEHLLTDDFDPAGINLVEASAGTGKTYSIETLYLRLVVAHGIPVEKLLVVTFTDAATAELRERLRAILEECRQRMENGGDAPADRIAGILKLPPGPSPGEGDQPRDAKTLQMRRIRRALLDFDQAAVFTIHGFCQRALNEFAFECGQDFDADVISGEAQLAEICADRWRSITYGMPDSVAGAIVQGNFPSPDRLTRLAETYTGSHGATLLPAHDENTVASARQKLNDALRIAVACAAENREMIERDLASDDSAPFFETACGTIMQQILRFGNDRTPETEQIRIAGTLFKALSPGKPKGSPRKGKWVPGAATGTLIQALKDLLEAAGAPFSCMATAAELKTIAARYDARKREEQGMTFDDMLVRLLQALEKDATVSEAIRGAYEAALVDEFQDTDPVQYRIFRKLFATGTLPLFFVGDPKQAIYSFRGGDIYTYCTARQSVQPGRRYDLATNYRSQQPLIKAVNSIFKNRGDGGSLFGHPAIAYADDLACNGLDDCFQDHGERDTRPFKIWQYRSPEGKTAKRSAGIDSPAAKNVYRDVAAEIVRLLNDKTTGFAPADGANATGSFRKLKASDIAILVRRHREAAYLYRELVLRGVPAVRQAADNVFDSAEAKDLVYLLRAMQEPGNLQYVRTALASSLIPVTENELEALSRSERVGPAAAADGTRSGCPGTLDDWLILFHDASERWRRNGFFAASALLAAKAAIKAHLAAQPGGERRLVNFVQLNDLLHRAATGQGLGPAALLAWYVRQLDHETREANDAFETRLESDEDAVQIMTVFKSKGLEFPVVFVPTMWTGRIGERLQNALLYHEESVVRGTATGGTLPTLYMHLDTTDAVAKQLSSLERSQEDIRNFYVAATRASFRTYVVTGDFCANDSTLAKCLPPDLLEEWRGTHDSGIDVCSMGGGPDEITRLKPCGQPTALDVKGTAVVDKTRGHASFSSIAPQGATAIAGTPEVNNVDAEDATEEEAAAPVPRQLDIFTFPAGARTGDCWHRIFELLDFTAGDDVIRETVNAQLALSRLDKGRADETAMKRDITFNMVKCVLNNPIATGNGTTFRLRDIRKTKRRSEMGFNFSLHGSGQDADDRQRNAVWTVLNAAWKSAAEHTEEALFLKRLENWTRRIPDGFMTGFIDLIFEQGGRYYILDWKSNRLGGRPANFERDGMVNEMAAHAYFLQVLVYTVAVDRYLRQSLRDYDYQTHFGGVLYLFVRGIEENSQRGIYYSKPPRDLIENLSAALATKAGEVING